MEVAHGVNCENIGEHWNEKHVDKQAHHVTHEVLQEIDWPEDDWHQVDTEHNGTTKH